MLDFTFNVSQDTRKLEKQMSDIQAAIDELKATVANEAAQVTDKIDALTAALETGQIDKDAVVSQLKEIGDSVSKFIPDEPPVEPPVGE